MAPKPLVSKPVLTDQLKPELGPKAVELLARELVKSREKKRGKRVAAQAPRGEEDERLPSK